MTLSPTAIGVYLTLACGVLAPGAEIAVLDTGMRIKAERVERDGARTILHMAGGGTVEMDSARVAAVERFDAPAPPAPPAAAPELPPAPPVKSVSELVTEAALRHGLPPEIVHSVAQAESGYNAAAVSPKGALGVMQLMPATARQLNADPASVEQNIDAGTRLLRDLLLRYQDGPNPVRRALAAYNAGERAVDRYNGVPPYAETRGYVERVIANYWKNVRVTDAAASGTK